jgi:hypothetical protein
MAVVEVINTFRVIPGVFACFRVLKSSVSAGDLRFRNGFDSRQPLTKRNPSAWANQGSNVARG